MPEIESVTYICLLALNNLVYQKPDLVVEDRASTFLLINRGVSTEDQKNKFINFSELIHRQSQNSYKTSPIEAVIKGNLDHESIDFGFLLPCTQDLSDQEMSGFFQNTSRILKPEGLLTVIYDHWWDMIPGVDNPYLRTMVKNIEFLVNNVLINPRSLDRLIRLGEPLKPVLLANGDSCSLAVFSQPKNPLPVFEGLPFAYGSDFIPNYAAIPFFEGKDLAV